ncbi:MAG: LLM class F420-dependent oxidoreductase [Chloroflexi bacterium]|nr:LLM class F420-dependent oxidoreductase [Chloroflexota bacterium]|tara:strand:- start:1661 stop:2530 length:870 start_codon:yes stop_codon:yes gene_type:complete
MQLGVVFPQTEIGSTPEDIRTYALSVEATGYEHLLAYDHVLGANRSRTGGFTGKYDHESMFHEPFVLFGYLAAITKHLELVTGIIILPQRQTALVAKQATEIDILSGGRLRLGIGVGWNPVEYEALGQDFHIRGRRIEEQITLLRRLWTEPLVSFIGDFDQINDAGLNPLPEKSIPIWFGGMSPVVLDRLGRMADGWFPQYQSPSELPNGLERIYESANDAGRDPKSIGVEARINIAGRALDDTITEAHQWIENGISHLSVNTMGENLSNVNEHILLVQKFKEAFDKSL